MVIVIILVQIIDQIRKINSRLPIREIVIIIVITIVIVTEEKMRKSQNLEVTKNPIMATKIVKKIMTTIRIQETMIIIAIVEEEATITKIKKMRKKTKNLISKFTTIKVSPILHPLTPLKK